MFVRTDQGQWNNLSRASAVSVEADRYDNTRWIVLAHYSGKTVRLKSFATQTEAQAWADEILGEVV